MDKELTMSTRNRSKRFWIWLVAIVVGVPVLVVLGLLAAVMIRAAVVEAPRCSIDILNSAETPGIEDGKHQDRVQRLSDALKFQTISWDENNQTVEQFQPFIQYLEANFPTIHTSDYVTKTQLGLSLLYKIQGKDEGKQPYLLTAHMDVVPGGDPDAWDYPPFSGEIADGFVYGRGAIDDKGSLMGIMEALEYWLSQGEQPRRTFFLGFGHDEEIGGHQGAAKIAETLRSSGVAALDFVLDEGLMIVDKLLPGVKKPVALIGVSEKGSLYLELSVKGKPLHSSFPPKESPIGILGEAVARLERKQQPLVFGKGPERDLFEYVAPDASYGMRMFYANLWLFKDLIGALMQKDALQSTLIKTSTGLTKFNSGVKDNIIPGEATALVNHRVHPAQTVSEVVERDRKSIGDDRVQMTVKSSMEAHRVSPFGPADLAYQLIATSISQSFEQVVVAPCIMIANTDTIHYLGFSNKIYRIFPTLITPADAARYHGDNERIGVDDYQRVVNFYYRLMQNSDLVYDLAPGVGAKDEF